MSVGVAHWAKTMAHTVPCLVHSVRPKCGLLESVIFLWVLFWSLAGLMQLQMVQKEHCLVNDKKKNWLNFFADTTLALSYCSLWYFFHVNQGHVYFLFLSGSGEEKEYTGLPESRGQPFCGLLRDKRWYIGNDSLLPLWSLAHNISDFKGGFVLSGTRTNIHFTLKIWG